VTVAVIGAGLAGLACARWVALALVLVALGLTTRARRADG